MAGSRTTLTPEQRLARAVGQRIRELRAERGWDQIDLEAHLDGHIKRATISDFETGRRLPSLRTLLRLAQAFDVDPAALLLAPTANEHHRVAAAVLRADDASLAQLRKIIGPRRPS